MSENPMSDRPVSIEPLTAEEEGALRADHVPGYRHEWCSYNDMHSPWPCDEVRLLATLDAARSEHPERAKACHVRCAARRRSATPSSEGDAWPSDKDLHDSLAAHARSPEHHYTADDCRRALATTPARSDAGDGLDVGRLALFDALIDEGFAHIAALMREVPSWKPAYYGAEVWLREVPRRVARLSESTGSEKGR